MLAAVLAVLALAGVAFALPFIASNRIVRDRIALELSDWSGYAVSIGAAPEIRIWPDFEAILKDVSLRPKGEPGSPPVIQSESVEIELSPIAALSGDVVFHSARLIGPVLHVHKTPAGHFAPAPPGEGRIAHAIEVARAIVQERSDGSEASGLPADLFGSVEFTGGSILADGGEIATGVAGRLDWPALNRPGAFTAEGVWRGETVAVDLASSSPLILFGGGGADLSATLRSTPASLRFEGTAQLSEKPHFQGQGKFIAPSIRRLLRWSDAGAASAPAGSLGVEGRFSGDIGGLSFEEATVIIGEVSGTGVIDVALAGTRPTVSGTLAFDSLDFGSLLAAFAPPEDLRGKGPGEIASDLADWFGLDLRMSAATATLGDTALSDVAATARVSEQGAAFDISDAAAFGGAVQAGVRLRRNGAGENLEMRLLATEIDGGAFAAAAGMTGLVPIGRGNVSIILTGRGTTWQSFIGSAGGSIAASFGSGALSGIDLHGFRERLDGGGIFPLEEVRHGTLPIDAADLKATVAGGVARIDKAEARWPEARLNVTGVASYQGRGLALSGSIEPTAEQPSTEAKRFFVGGSWSSPYVLPIAGSRQQ